MPRLSVWAIRSALVYLALGVTCGALLLANKGVSLSPLVWRLLPVHIEFLLMGWILQLIMGVGFWILPRFHSARGNVRAAWLAYVLLNMGVLLAGLGPTLGASQFVALLGRSAEAGAALAFALHAWPRVKPPGA